MEYSVLLQNFLQKSDNEYLKRLFATKESRWNLKRLKEELAALDEEVKASSEKPVSNDFNKMPLRLQESIKKRNEARRKRNFYFAQLLHLQTDSERAKNLDVVLQSDRTAKELQIAIDFFYKNGNWIEEGKFVLPEQPDKLLSRRNSLRANISRDRKRGKDITKWQQELEVIENKLKYAIST